VEMDFTAGMRETEKQPHNEAAFSIELRIS
jgi:hypothetical protein